jgi:hypothetical protein
MIIENINNKIKIIFYQDKYLLILIINIFLIVYVDINLRLLLIQLIYVIIGVLIVVIHHKNFVMIKNAKNVLKNHLHQMKNLNFGQSIITYYLGKYLIHHTINIILNVNGNINLEK